MEPLDELDLLVHRIFGIWADQHRVMMTPAAMDAIEARMRAVLMAYAQPTHANISAATKALGTAIAAEDN